jgi:hypothetical protein
VLGREVRDLTTSATGSDRRLGRELATVQDSLVNQIDQATAGKYRPARAQFRTDMQVMDAFDKGSEILQNRATKAGLREDTPDAWREWTGNASPEELKAAQLGARSMIEQKIGGLRKAVRVRPANPASYAGFLPPTLAELGGIAAGMPELGHAAALGTGALSALRFAQTASAARWTFGGTYLKRRC